MKLKMLALQKKNYDKPWQHIKKQRPCFTNKVHIFKAIKAMVFPVVMYGCEICTIIMLNTEELMLLNYGVADCRESLGLQRDQISQSKRKSTQNIHWKNRCWNWNSNTLATWCEELTHWKRPWCWERLRMGREEDDRGWDGWMASPTWWTWVWASSRSSWWTGKPGVLQSMWCQSQIRLSDWTDKRT